jgi:hypothetical protein
MTETPPSAPSLQPSSASFFATPTFTLLAANGALTTPARSPRSAAGTQREGGSSFTSGGSSPTSAASSQPSSAEKVDDRCRLAPSKCEEHDDGCGLPPYLRVSTDSFSLRYAGPVSGETATRESCSIKPMPEATARIPYARSFDAGEYRRVQRGLVPEQMEDKWFIFFEAPWLFFHRSWTGLCIYAVKLREEGDGAAVEEASANRSPDEYRETDAAHDARILAFLVDRLLLGLPATFPLRDDVDPAKASLLAHHVVGYGRSNDEGSS